jgi:hypothetical protein
MRQVTANAINAFLNRNASAHGNTAIVNYDDRTELQLFGHTIAKLVGDTLYVTFAGYPTVTKTTKERLNGLFDIRYGTRPFYIKRHVLHCDDNPIHDDQWYRVVDGKLAVATEPRTNTRIDELTGDIYTAVFETVDGESEYTGDEAGVIATRTAELFGMLCKGMDVTLMTAGSE